MLFNISLEDKGKQGVYVIKNIVDNKIYIGSTSNSFYNRYHQHLSDYNKNKHHSRFLSRSFAKHGLDKFEFSILCICSKENCIKMEQWYLDNNITDYNSCLIAGSLLGVKHSDTSKTRTVIGGKHHSAVPVDQYNLKGEYIKSFPCVSDAIYEVGLMSRSGIVQACKGKVYSAKGYRWSYEGKPLPDRPNRTGKMAISITIDGQTIKFNSQVEAANYISSLGFKCNQGRINRALKSSEKVYGFTIKKT